MGAIGKIFLAASLTIAGIAGCKKQAAVAPTTAPAAGDSLPTTAPAEPVASADSVAKFVASARQFLAHLNAMSELLKTGLTLDNYRKEVKNLEAALAAVGDPPPESVECQSIMNDFREAVLNYRKAETHLVNSLPDPERQKKLTGQELAEYQRKLKRSADFRDNCYQTAYRLTYNATNRLDELTGK